MRRRAAVRRRKTGRPYAISSLQKAPRSSGGQRSIPRSHLLPSRPRKGLHAAGSRCATSTSRPPQRQFVTVPAVLAALWEPYRVQLEQFAIKAIRRASRSCKTSSVVSSTPWLSFTAPTPTPMQVPCGEALSNEDACREHVACVDAVHGISIRLLSGTLAGAPVAR